jgi:hypothetical protein
MKDSTKMMLGVTILSSLIVLSSAVTTKAEELTIPPARDMWILGGVMCGSQYDVEVLLTGISLNNGNNPENSPESCGRFVPEQPILMTVTPTHWYDAPMANTLVAKFYHAESDWTQWGWLAYIPNPDYVPPNTDDPT